MSAGSEVVGSTQGVADVVGGRETTPSCMNLGGNRGDFAFLPVPTGGLGGGWVGNYRARENFKVPCTRRSRRSTGSPARNRVRECLNRGEGALCPALASGTKPESYVAPASTTRVVQFTDLHGRPVAAALRRAADAPGGVPML